jgi:ribonuclease P protein component
VDHVRQVRRLKTRAQFEAVMAAGIAARTAHFALHRMPNPVPVIGVVIPKRWARRAVTRNTIKRQIYSVSAISNLPAAAHVVRLRTGFEGFGSATSEALRRAVRAELLQLFSQGGA